MNRNRICGTEGSLFINGEEVLGLESIEISLEKESDKEPSFLLGSSSFSGTMKVEKFDSPYRKMSPILRKHFKSVRMMGKTYI